MVANEHKVFTKWVKDPLYAIVKRFLNERHTLVKEQGGIVEKHLAEYRYTDSKPEDFILESVYLDKNGTKKICLIKRDKTFARVDLPVIQLDMVQLANEFHLPLVTCSNLTDFKNKFNRGEVQGKLLHLVWRNTLGVCVRNAEALNLNKFNNLITNIFFEKEELYRETETSINPTDMTSGGILITDESVGTQSVYLFVEELVEEQLDKTTVSDNFPESLSGRRGDELRHTNLFTVDRVDVTAKTELTFRSKNGYISGKQSPNKLESIFTFIRGSKNTILNDQVEIDILVTHEEYIHSKRVTIDFRIEHDVITELTVSAQTEFVRSPSMYNVGVVVKCKEGETVVTPTGYPEWLSCSLTNDKYLLDKSWDDGLLYVGKPSKIINDLNSNFKDLITGEFVYQGKISKLFVELEVIKPLGQQETIELIQLEPVIIAGEKNDTGNVDYHVRLKGGDISLSNCGLKPGLLGGKQLVRITDVLDNQFKYQVIQDSNAPGVVITDNGRIDLQYPDIDGLLYKRNDVVGISVLKGSVVDLHPRNGFNPVVSKYQKGPLPFQVYINGNESSDKVRSIYIENSETSPVIINFDPWTIKETWIVVDGEETSTKQNVVFKFKLLVDGMERDFEWTQEFELLGYTGTNVAIIPGVKELSGRELETGNFDVCVYYKRERINERCQFLPGNSNLPSNVVFNPIKAHTPQSVTVGYSLVTQGQVNSKIAYGVIGEPSETFGILEVDTFIQPAYPLQVTMAGEVVIEPFLSNKLPCSISFNGNNVSLTDPRVNVSVKLSYLDVELKEIVSDGFVLTAIKDVKMSETLVSEIDVEIRISDQGVNYWKELGGLVKVSRKVITATKVEVLTNDFIPSTKQAILYKLIDQDNQLIYNAKTAGVGYENGDNNYPTIIGTDSYVELVDSVNGIYRSHLMLSHLGGKGSYYISVNLGGTVLRSDKIPLSVISAIPKVSNITDGIAIMNVQTPIGFTVKLDKYLEPNSILNAIKLGKVTFDPTYIVSVKDFVKVNEQGVYSVTILSNGKLGETQLRVILTTNENGFERNWDTIVSVEMKR